MPPRRAPRVRLNITPDIIAHGVRQDSGHCILADAVRAAVPGATHISVDLQTIRWSDPAKGVRYVYLTPPAGQTALINFDEGVPPEPFSCTVSNGHTATIHHRGPRVIVPAGERAPAIPYAQRSKGIEERLPETRAAILALIKETGGIPSGRAVARALGKTDDRMVRGHWDTLAERGEVPPRHKDMPAVSIEGGQPPPVGVLAGERRVYGIRQLRLRKSRLLHHTG